MEAGIEIQTGRDSDSMYDEKLVMKVMLTKCLYWNITPCSTKIKLMSSVFLKRWLRPRTVVCLEIKLVFFSLLLPMWHNRLINNNISTSITVTGRVVLCFQGGVNMAPPVTQQGWWAEEARGYSHPRECLHRCQDDWGGWPGPRDR